MERTSEVSYWDLNEMSGSGVCLRLKIYSYLSWFISFLISEVKQYEETMTNEQSQNERGAIESMRSHTQNTALL